MTHAELHRPRRTVLVCDDEPAVRFAIEEALQALDVDVIAAASGGPTRSFPS